MTTSHRRPTRAQALPQRETTMLVEGISKKIIECKARQKFTLGYVTLQENDAFFLVRSERRENRYYIVRFNDGHCRYQCSCGCGFAEHQHLEMVREHVAAAKPVEVRESVAQAMVKAAAALPAKLQKVTLVAAEASVAKEDVAPVAQTEEVAEVDGRAKVEQEIARLLSVYKTYKISDLRYRASKRGIDIKSRKRVDFINAILSSDRLMLEREYCLV